MITESTEKMFLYVLILQKLFHAVRLLYKYRPKYEIWPVEL